MDLNSIFSDAIHDGTIYAPFRTEFYWRPWSHGSVYFIGLAFGYFIRNIKQKILSIVRLHFSC